MFEFLDVESHLQPRELRLLRVVLPLPHDRHQPSRTAVPVKQLLESAQNYSGSIGPRIGTKNIFLAILVSGANPLKLFGVNQLLALSF